MALGAGSSQGRCKAMHDVVLMADVPCHMTEGRLIRAMFPVAQHHLFLTRIRLSNNELDVSHTHAEIHLRPASCPFLPDILNPVIAPKVLNPPNRPRSAVAQAIDNIRALNIEPTSHDYITQTK